MAANGWVASHTDSGWRSRIPLIVGALLGCGIATYLTLYQLGVLATVWDPLFDGMSRRVLHSPLSRMLPVPDSALGAAAYLVEAITAAIGPADRWRSMRGLTLLYGAELCGLALASAGLIAYQAFVLHAWCTVCLCSAILSFVLLAAGLRESLAALRESPSA